MDNIAGSKSSLSWAVHLSMLLLVILWIFPTVGLLVSSFRTGDQIVTSGWWKSFMSAEQVLTLRAADPTDQIQQGGVWVVEGNLFVDMPQYEIASWGTSSKDVAAHEPGATVDLKEGEQITVQANGDYTWTAPEQLSGRGQRVFVTAEIPPVFTIDNYDRVLGQGVLTDLVIYLAGALAITVAAHFSLRGLGFAEPKGYAILIGVAAFLLMSVVLGLGSGIRTGAPGDDMGRAFFNTLTVTIPSTIIPITVAAFAAYALAWMDFPGRSLLIAAIVGLLVVPLQLALIPLLKFHNEVGIGKGYLGVWLAHTGFGMPLAIYLLRNYMAGLPRDIIENAKVDGATDFQIFVKIILPLSFPALASFAIFQFLWTWNDLLVAKVFLIDPTQGTTVMTDQIVQIMGSRGGQWEILATAAFVSIAVPLVVFFSMQKYLVRGLLAGSVK